MDGFCMFYLFFEIKKNKVKRTVTTPVAMSDTCMFLVITEKTIPVKRTIGTSLKTRHHLDDFLNVLDFNCFINFAITCWYPNKELKALLLNETKVD